MSISPYESGSPDHTESDGVDNDANPIARIVEPRTLALHVVKDRKLVHYDQAARRQADAFREIRTRLLSLGGGKNFVTLVAPVSPRCGGSFVSCNLAAAFAFHDAKNAVLVDCDLGHPSQHDNLNVDPVGGGLAEYLEHRHASLDKVIYRTRIPQLGLIPVGSGHNFSAEHFSSARMREMLSQLISEDPSRYVVLDAPAVNASPDARILSELADFVVLVAGSGRDTAEDIRKAASNFGSDKFAGVVFNQLP